MWREPGWESEPLVAPFSFGQTLVLPTPSGSGVRSWGEVCVDTWAEMVWISQGRQLASVMQLCLPV